MTPLASLEERNDDVRIEKRPTCPFANVPDLVDGVGFDVDRERSEGVVEPLVVIVISNVLLEIVSSKAHTYA